jgi:hemerythrin
MNALKNKPEVLDQICHEHAALREKLSHINCVLAERKPASEELELLLREFLNTLIVHFSNEENEGFFKEIVSRAPQLAEDAGKLCVEHRELLHEVTELSRFAAAGSPSMSWWRELSSRCHVISRKLMRHESDESRLWQRAFQEEVAAGLEICS